jgi:restriction system protein
LAQSTHAWMVRAGNDNELADVVSEKSLVAIGWSDMGDLSQLKTREAVKERYREVYPEHAEGRVAVNAGQLYRFAHEIDVGDCVMTYLKNSRELLIGRVTGPYEYREVMIHDHYPHIRTVEWIKRTSRDAFGPAARNSMGSTLTVFNLDDYLDQIKALAVDKEAPVPDVEEETPPFHEEVQAKADELIADMVSHLDPYDFQNLVAAVLRAMGFRAHSSPPGPDRGVDVVAYRDSLGFETPRIKAQVKHTKATVGAPDMRSFLATLHVGDSGLYVSTAGFTTEARMEAAHAHVPVTVLDRESFISLMLENYEALDPEFKAKVPLRRVWVPAA